MIRVVICDDEITMCNQLEEYCKRWGQQHNIIVTVRRYNNPGIFLADYRDDTDILLLDIQMEKMDGLQVAQKLRQQEKNVCILFVTNRQDYAIACYRVRPFSFLPKPLAYEDFALEFGNAVQNVMDSRTHDLVVRTPQGLHKLSVQAIEYIEVNDHMLTVHQADGVEKVCYGSISSIRDQLAQHGFLRCHSAFLVNQAYIRDIRRSDLITVSGKCIPISKHRRAALLEDIARFAGMRI